MPQTWTCTEIYDMSVPPVLTGQTCTVTSYATSTEASTTSLGYNGVPYHDWSLYMLVFLFMLSFMFWPRLFAIFRKKS
jgi:hypothetical protein